MQALGILNDLAAVISKSNHVQRDVRLQHTNRRISLVNQFVQARLAASNDVGQMFFLCQELLMQPNIDSFVRVGDIYGCMVESYLSMIDVEKSSSFLR